ncbi:MAG: hypothetical protein F6K40_20040 [Okeania sp. SIO3I5]|nr:hypothetical protein [Okeania sp. SIO3I5]
MAYFIRKGLKCPEQECCYFCSAEENKSEVFNSVEENKSKGLVFYFGSGCQASLAQSAAISIINFFSDNKFWSVQTIENFAEKVKKMTHKKC